MNLLNTFSQERLHLYAFVCEDNFSTIALRVNYGEEYDAVYLLSDELNVLNTLHHDRTEILSLSLHENLVLLSNHISVRDIERNRFEEIPNLMQSILAWHYQNPKKTYEVIANNLCIRANTITIDPTGHFLAAGTSDYRVKIFDLTRIDQPVSSQTHMFVGHLYNVIDVRWSADSHYLLSFDDHCHLRIWDFKTQRSILSVELKESAYDAYDWDPANLVLAYQDQSLDVIIYDIKTNAEKLRIPIKESGTILINSTAQQLLVLGETTSGLWDLKTGQIISHVALTYIRPKYRAWHPSGRFLSYYDWERHSIKLYDLIKDQELPIAKNIVVAGHRQAQWNTAGDQLLICTENQLLLYGFDQSQYP